MPASSELVFITGATGHVGFKVLQDVLQAGYRARLAVRSEAKEQTILGNPTFKALNAADRVEFVIVPDLTVPGAYDEAVKGVDYAIHIASPLMGGHTTDEDYKEHLIKPAVQKEDLQIKAPSGHVFIKIIQIRIVINIFKLRNPFIMFA